MDAEAEAKELIRKEKERRRLEREQKREQNKRLKLGIEVGTEAKNAQGVPSLHLNLNLDLNTVQNLGISHVAAEGRTRTIPSAEGYVTNNRIEEPLAPTNKKSSNRNLKREFEEYTRRVNNPSIVEEENLNRNVKKQKCDSIDEGVINNLANDSAFISKKRKSKIQGTENEVHVINDKDKIEELYTNESFENGEIRNGGDNTGNNEEVLQVFELVESDSEYAGDMDKELLEGKLKSKKNTYGKKYGSGGDPELSVSIDTDIEELSENECEYPNAFAKNSTSKEGTESLVEDRYRDYNFPVVGEMKSEKFFDWFQNYLHGIEKNAPDQSAYYEEIEYLLKMLKEKKKVILGNLCCEGKELDVQEATEENILEELEAFHKKVLQEKEPEKNTETEKTTESYIAEIYEKLGITQKEEDIIGFSVPTEETNVDDKEKGKFNETGKHKDVQKLPKGFFDAAKQKEYLKKQADLEKIDEHIKFLEKEKRKLLQEYEDMGHIYDETINSYIDYLYDDECHDKEDDIIQEGSDIHHKNEKTKGDQLLLIESMLENEKKKKKKKL